MMVLFFIPFLLFNADRGSHIVQNNYYNDSLIAKITL